MFWFNFFSFEYIFLVWVTMIISVNNNLIFNNCIRFTASLGSPLGAVPPTFTILHFGKMIPVLMVIYQNSKAFSVLKWAPTVQGPKFSVYKWCRFFQKVWKIFCFCFCVLYYCVSYRPLIIKYINIVRLGKIRVGKCPVRKSPVGKISPIHFGIQIIIKRMLFY